MQNNAFRIFKPLGYIKNYILIYIILLAIFIGTLTLACLIPTSLLTDSINESLITLKKEGTYPSVGISWRKIALDNFTDALMFNVAYSIDSNQPLKSSLLNLRLFDTSNSSDQIASLEKLTLYQNHDYPQAGYDRYWHGYLIYLRPLLAIVSYSQIRIIITISLWLFFLYYVFLVWKRLGIRPIIALTFGLIAVDYFFIGKSIQFSGVFLVGILSSIYLLWRSKNKYINLNILFFITGGLTSFVDLLTAPMVSLGILLFTTYITNNKPKDLITKPIYWSIGYLLIWFSKWVIAQLFYANNAISNAIGTIASRTIPQSNAGYNFITSINLNYLQLRGYDKQNKYILLYCLIMFFLIFLRYASINKQKIKSSIPWVLIGLIPYLWYTIATNHTYMHVWYTYRNQLVSVIALFMIATEFMDLPRFRSDLRKLLIKIVNLFKPRLNRSNH